MVEFYVKDSLNVTVDSNTSPQQAFSDDVDVAQLYGGEEP